MERKSPSQTAEDMAGFRAMEMLRPKEDRICDDPLARHFLTGAWVSRASSLIRSKIYQGITHLFNPGAQNTVPARVRFMDEYTRTCSEKGMTQLVILGAGYDSRAYRLEELKAGVTVFEVDHPATQAYKKKVIANLLGGMPGNVAFVPYQLDNKGFENPLLEKGYDPDKQSLFIMEGLIMYLDPEVVTALFSLIHKLCCPKSAVVFDFLPPGIVDGSIPHRGGKNMHKYVQKRGEPFRFGIDAAKHPPFLSSMGYDDINIVTAQQCKKLYFKAGSANRSVSPLFTFAHAIVRPSNS